MKYLYNICKYVMQNPLNARRWHYETSAINRCCFAGRDRQSYHNKRQFISQGPQQEQAPRLSGHWIHHCVHFSPCPLSAPRRPLSGWEPAHATPARSHTPLPGHHDGRQDVTWCCSEATGTEQRTGSPALILTPEVLLPCVGPRSAAGCLFSSLTSPA